MLLGACATGPGRPPTAFEQRLFTIDTNYLPAVRLVTNVVVATQTVAVVTPAPEVLQVTNHLGQAQRVTNVAYLTNRETLLVWATNIAPATNLEPAYTLTPNERAAAIVAGGRVAGDFFGVGGLAGTLLGGLFGLWGALRSTRANRAAQALAQIIETGRAILQQTPQGRRLDGEWKSWMVSHQAEAGVLAEVTKIVQQAVDNETAQTVAAQLLALMNPPEPQPEPVSNPS